MGRGLGHQKAEEHVSKNLSQGVEEAGRCGELRLQAPVARAPVFLWTRFTNVKSSSISGQ